MNNTNSILIVNDVQIIHPGGSYDSDYAPLAKIEEQIDFARAKGDFIFLVMIDKPECDKIHPRILKRVAGYARCRIVAKPDEYNGAKWIVKMGKSLGLPMAHFRIVGFQTHRCVQSTTRGLKVLLPKCCIEVIKDACDDQDGNRWRIFPELPGVSLVTSKDVVALNPAPKKSTPATAPVNAHSNRTQLAENNA